MLPPDFPDDGRVAPHIRRRTGDPDVTSKEIDGVSDLVVWAPIREGFIEAFNNVTYESRLRLVAEALHNVRKSAREYEDLEPFADTAKRILSLLDFRIGIVDRDLIGAASVTGGSGEDEYRPRKYMYLVATFDGPWEPYIRRIYDPLGPFLDLVLCNCEGYVPATRCGFEEYSQWVRDNQLDSAIFYSTSGLTVGDKIYLEELERIHRSNTPDVAEGEISRFAFDTPDEAAATVREDHPRESLVLGLEALNVLYKLTDFYPPHTHDGYYLIRAARDLLSGLKELLDKYVGKDSAKPDPALALPINWFRSDIPEPNRTGSEPEFEPGEIQKGLLSSYDSEDFTVTHGALLLMKINDAERVREFLKLPGFSWEGGKAIHLMPGGMLPRFYSNIAFTYSGLQHMDVPEGELATFPKEFRQGMESRAPLIGDKLHNHPRHWKLPKRNWPPKASGDARPIELSEIDFIIQIRSSVQDDSQLDQYLEFADLQEAVVPYVGEFFSRGETLSLRDFLLELDLPGKAIPGENIFNLLVAFFEVAGRRFGFSILGIESMFRPGRFANTPENKSSLISPTANTDHFGFRDGISQPCIKQGTILPPEPDPMDVLRGDLIYGFPNSRTDQHSADQKQRLAFNGSFLVVRKIAQNVARMQDFDKEAEKRGTKDASSLLVGRTKGGKPLVDLTDVSNAFTYKSDAEGEACPFSSHIRLANPRKDFLRRPTPKILRRGMTYGPSFESAPDADRGVIFMAYCASISEQYEIIQRWLNGANSTGVSSSRNDGLTGSRPRNELNSHTFTCIVDGTPRRFDLTEPFTTLEWGSYFFVPSKSAIRRIANAPNDPTFKALRDKETGSREATGRRHIERLSKLSRKVQQEEWKKLIEDFLTKDPKENDLTPKVWEAIDAMGGVFKVESGIAFDEGSNSAGDPASQKVILVTDEAKILEVLGQHQVYDPDTFSSSTQYKRINDKGFGTIYVCLDDGETYWEEAGYANDVLIRCDRYTAVKAGYTAAQSVLQKAIKAYESQNPPGSGAPHAFKMELSRQFTQPAIAALCQHWYGIPDGIFFKEGPWDWNQARGFPVCPGDFLATSRQTFYPRPTAMIQDYGRTHGRFLYETGMKYIKAVWTQDPVSDPIGGTISQKLHKDMRGKDQADPGNTEHYQDLLLRNIIGGMVGAIPPMDSCLRWAIHDWLVEKTLWTHQNAYRLRQKAYSAAAEEAAPARDKYHAALDALLPPLQSAMCVRPAPDLLYRTVKKGGAKIGPVTADEGDMVILCLSAATQKNLRNGSNDVSVVFGGNRKREDGHKDPESGLHACPAKDLALGGMTGILSALMNVGRIKALPASLIVEISDWAPPGSG